MIFEIANLDPKLNTSGRFGLKIAMFLILMKFGTQIKSNILIMNILIGIDDFDPKFAKFGLRTEMCSNFYEIGTWSKSNMLIMNIVLGIDDLDPKL